LKNIKPGPQAFKQIKNLVGKSVDKNTSVSVNGQNLLNVEQKLLAFKTHFEELYKERPIHLGIDDEIVNTVEAFTASQCDSQGEVRPLKQFSSHDSSLNDFVTVEDLLRIRKSLNSKHSSGPDDISNYIIKKLPFSAFRYLSIIFNNCRNNGYFPTTWKIARLIPIPKNKRNNEITNFRPISLLSNLGKLLERVICEKFDEFCEENNVIPKNQFGFRKNHSTTDALLKLHNDIVEGLRQKESSIILKLDAEKAFDAVWHIGLKYKIIQLNVPNDLTRLILSFLSNRSMFVEIEGKKSDTFQINSGVPQGSIMGPKLYNVYISDIPSTHCDGRRRIRSDTILYADDVIIKSKAPNPLVAQKYVENHAQKIVEYNSKWKININASKSEFICIRNASGKGPRRAVSQSKEVKIQINGVNVSYKSLIKYLGINFSNLFKFNSHVKETLKKANGAYSLLRPLLANIHLIPKTKTLLYKQMIKPILTYGFPIWFCCSTTYAKKLELFERKILRHCLNKYYSSANRRYSNKYLYENTKIEPLMNYMCKSTIKFVEKVRSHPNQLIKSIYNENNLNESNYLSPLFIGNNPQLFQSQENLPQFYLNKSFNSYHRG
jgi:uncharacterized protein YlbG (UPF0298 family)